MIPTLPRGENAGNDQWRKRTGYAEISTTYCAAREKTCCRRRRTS